MDIFFYNIINIISKFAHKHLLNKMKYNELTLLSRLK